MDIHMTNWMMRHFDVDPIERMSTTFILELSKTLAVGCFALWVIILV